MIDININKNSISQNNYKNNLKNKKNFENKNLIEENKTIINKNKYKYQIYNAKYKKNKIKIT